MTSSNMVKRYETGTVGRVFSILVEETYFGVQTLANKFSVNYVNLRIISAKLSRSAKQHPSNSAHLMRWFVRGLSKYVYQFFIPIDFRA
jgi:hypothetical protein